MNKKELYLIVFKNGDYYFKISESIIELFEELDLKKVDIIVNCDKCEIIYGL